MFKIYTHVKYFKMKYFQINKDKNQQHQDICDKATTTLKRAICSLEMYSVIKERLKTLR